MKIQRAIDQPIRLGGSWQERWNGRDKGLIASWEAGRQLSLREPEWGVRARGGQLVPLPWKGGLDKELTAPTKYGTLFYLAMWQGLRSEDLAIETEDETAIACSLNKTTVIFTNDSTKYLVD